MAANTEPIFPLTPKVSWGTVTTADATASKNHDGTTTSAVLLFTAGANGSRVDKIKAVALGTNVATCLRIFINNGSANTTATNNTLVKEFAVAATSISETAAMAENEWNADDENPCDIALPAGYKLYATLGTTVATGLQVTVFGGDY